MGPDIADGTTNAFMRPEPGNRPSRAYVTFLPGNGDYVKGVIGLAERLREVRSKYQLVVAILPEMPEDHWQMLVDRGCIVKEIELVYPLENQTQFAKAYYVRNYSKLRIWEVSLIGQSVENDKIIYLDGDIQVFDNIDHLFDLPNGFFYAVMDCSCKKTWSRTPHQYKIGYCQQCPNKVQRPDHLGQKPSLYFDAGMFVYEPNLDTYNDLLKTLEISPPTSFAEPDSLNKYFRDIYKPVPNVHMLEIVHYCAEGTMPWQYAGREENMDENSIKKLVNIWGYLQQPVIGLWRCSSSEGIAEAREFGAIPDSAVRDPSYALHNFPARSIDSETQRGWV